ncbi:hypothetical protein BDN70DRAFT_715187 [Pholiota conissans]|uniref:Uncharacterized protein n=1 Tax=Pholiota conissans TaxID=109636 RepID=A0A9P6CT56_9AGAR|nr:hypothetical protein BDN70DRAFT_715187 [Pholiota conissans]
MMSNCAVIDQHSSRPRLSVYLICSSAQLVCLILQDFVFHARCPEIEHLILSTMLTIVLIHRFCSSFSFAYCRGTEAEVDHITFPLAATHPVNFLTRKLPINHEFAF